MTKSANWMKIILQERKFPFEVPNLKECRFVVRSNRSKKGDDSIKNSTLERHIVKSFFLTSFFHHDIRMCNQTVLRGGAN